MKCVLVLDPTTIIGSTYMDKSDSTLSGFPVLHCAEVDLSHHALLRVVRRSQKLGDRSQVLWVPYHAVAFLAEYGDQETAPFGFQVGTISTSD